MPAKPQMGDIGFVSVCGVVGFLIRLGQWLNGNGFRKYQHAFIVIDGDRLVEAQPGGAHVVSLSKYKGTNVVFYRMPGITRAQQLTLAGIAQHFTVPPPGVPYSFLDYFALAGLRFHLPVKLLQDYVAATQHLICSQLADLTYNLAKIKIFQDGRFPGYVTPLELLARVQELGWERVDVDPGFWLSLEGS